MPFTYNLQPDIFAIGPIHIRWYSLAYVIGFLLAYWILMRFAEKGRIKGLDRDKAEEFVIWLMVGVIAGARLLEAIVYEPAYFAQQPWKIIAVWEGGMSFHGGLLGAIVAAYWFCRKRKVSFYQMADLLVLPATIAIFLGRIANFINGELVGTVTNVAWCINYPGLAGCRHPSQFYEAFAEGLRQQGKRARQKLQFLSLFYETCAQNGVDPACGHAFNPVRTVKKADVKNFSGIVVLGRLEIDALLQAVDRESSLLGKRGYAMLLVELATALPATPLRMLRWGDLELNAEEAPVAVTPGRAMTRTGENLHRFDLPVEAAAAVIDYLSSAGRLESIRPEDILFAPTVSNAWIRLEGKAEELE
jgi:integrase